MSFQDDTCDFCKQYMDPIGCDTKQIVTDKYWCGQCNISASFSEGMSESERKIAAFDELEKTLVALERYYWNNLWGPDINMDEKMLAQQRHFWVLDVEDARRRICAKYGLTSSF